MVAAGVDQVAIETFAHYFRLLEHGETGMIPESAIEPVDMEALRDVEVGDDDAAAAIRTTAVIKLNGGLGTSMGMDRAKSLLCVRRACPSSTSSPTGAPPPQGVRRAAAAAVHEQLPHLGRHHGRHRALRGPPGRGAAAGVPPEQEEPKLLPKDLAPVSWPRRPDLDGVPGPRRPLHRAARHRPPRAAPRRGLRTGLRVQLRQPRRRTRRASRGLVRHQRGAVRDRGGPRGRRATARAATSRAAGNPTAGSCSAQTGADPARGPGRPGDLERHRLLLDQQPLVRPARDEGGPRRPRRHPRPAADPQREDGRPERPDHPEGDPDRDRDGGRSRGVPPQLPAHRGRPRPVRARQDHQRPAGAPLRRLRHRVRLRARPGLGRHPVRRPGREGLQGGRRVCSTSASRRARPR